MPAPYPVAGIANAFLNRAALEGEQISHMKLQKLIYYAAGYYIAAYNTPLIDRAFEAWDYGPVVPSLYRQFRNFGNKPITEPAAEIDWDAQEERPVPIPAGDKRLDAVIDFVWKTYGKYSATMLSDMTHAEGTPWDKTKKAKPGIRDADIDNETLREYFEPRIKRSANA